MQCRATPPLTAPHKSVGMHGDRADLFFSAEQGGHLGVHDGSHGLGNPLDELLVGVGRWELSGYSRLVRSTKQRNCAYLFGQGALRRNCLAWNALILINRCQDVLVHPADDRDANTVPEAKE